jgi:hypothetical protein
MQSEPSKAEPPKRKLRWFQFSLRSLLLVITVISIWTPLLIKAAETIQQARESARHMRCYNNFKSSPGAVFISPTRPAAKKLQ